jgi:hypothetical protein
MKKFLLKTTFFAFAFISKLKHMIWINFDDLFEVCQAVLNATRHGAYFARLIYLDSLRIVNNLGKSWLLSITHICTV